MSEEQREETTPEDVRLMVNSTLDRLLAEAQVPIRRPRRTRPPDTVISRIEMIRQQADAETTGSFPVPPKKNER